MSDSDTMTVSEDERHLVSQIFKQADPQGLGVVTGEAALDIFGRSNLPPGVLSQIWDLADDENHGFLLEPGVIIAVRLMGWAQKSEKISPALGKKSGGPLPVLQGIPAPTPTKKTDADPPPLTVEDAQKYLKRFVAKSPVAGLLSGDSAREVFMESELPIQNLSKIWDLADRQQRGSLDAANFVLGMHLIFLLKSGQIDSTPLSISPQSYTQVSDTVSPLLLPSPSSSASPSPNKMPPTPSTPTRSRASTSPSTPVSASTSARPSAKSSKPTWKISTEERAFSDDHFDKLDAEKRGFVEGDAAAKFMLNSKLPADDLAHIWEVADTNKDNQLTRDEFAMVVHLITRRLSGMELPPKKKPQGLTPKASTSRVPSPSPSAITPKTSQSARAEAKSPADPSKTPEPVNEDISPSVPSFPDHPPSESKRTRPLSSSLSMSGRSPMDEYRKEKETLKARCKELTDQLAAERESRQLVLQERESLQEQLRDLEQSMSQVLSVTADEGSSKTELTQEVERLTAEVAALEQVREQLTDNTRLLEDMTQENQTFKLRLQEMESAAAATALEADELRNQAEGLKQDGDVLRMRLQEMERLFSHTGSMSSGQEMEILMADVTRENESLKARVREMEQSMGQMMLSPEARARNMDLRRANRRLTLRMEQLEMEATQLRANQVPPEFVEGLRSENEALKAQLREAQQWEAQQREALQREAQQREAQRREARQARSAAQEQLERQVAELEGQLAASRREFEALQQQRQITAPDEQEDTSVPPPAYDDAFVPVP